MQFLKCHPESAYTTSNSPHLRKAIVFDRELILLSHRIACHKVSGVSPEIKTEEDVEKVLRALRDVTLPVARLWEFYILDVSQHVEEFQWALERGDVCFEPHTFISLVR